MRRGCQVSDGERPFKNSGHFQHQLLLWIHPLNTLNSSPNHCRVHPLFHVDLGLQGLGQNFHPPVGNTDVLVLLKLFNGLLHISWISGGHSHNEILQLLGNFGLLTPQRFGDELLHSLFILGERLWQHMPPFRQRIFDRHMVFRRVSAYEKQGQIVAGMPIIRWSCQPLKSSTNPPKERHGLLAFRALRLLNLSGCAPSEA
mmetsp:Transcript_52493/g.115140  ORF Transcript_52493/g.115140 Transcript_52493/m.115140 type:complete len:201 (-) Transcript_52493:127-729(-)